MKKVLFAAFVAFWASVATIAALQGLSGGAGAPETGEDPAAALPGFTLTEVAEHSTLESCWKVIDGKVYDFTDYIPQHPTPPRVMEAWCGREASDAMRTKGIGRDHSPAAWAMMRPYLIGELVEN